MINNIRILFILNITLFLSYSCFSDDKEIKKIASGISTYFLFRWITNYRKCTLSFIECKIRGVKKEKGIIYQILDPIFDINKLPIIKKLPIYTILFIIFYKNTSYYQ